jgi:hypothetical protein
MSFGRPSAGLFAALSALHAANFAIALCLASIADESGCTDDGDQPTRASPSVALSSMHWLGLSAVVQRCV